MHIEGEISCAWISQRSNCGSLVILLAACDGTKPTTDKLIGLKLVRVSLMS
jgi:hypothetical protein